MVNYINVTLDTTAPATPTLSLDGGSAFANDLLVDCLIGTADGDTTDYSMKIWGSVLTRVMIFDSSYRSSFGLDSLFNYQTN